MTAAYRQCGIDGLEVFKSGAKSASGTRFLERVASGEIFPNAEKAREMAQGRLGGETEAPASSPAATPEPSAPATPAVTRTPQQQRRLDSLNPEARSLLERDLTDRRPASRPSVSEVNAALEGLGVQNWQSLSPAIRQDLLIGAQVGLGLLPPDRVNSKPVQDAISRAEAARRNQR